MVTVGKDRGRSGVITRVWPKDEAVLVEGLNQYKKHVKPAQGRPGEILTLSRPYNVSKVAMVCPKCKQITRVGYRFHNEAKVRVCRKCDSDIDIKVTKTKVKTKK